jgi:predicted PurR-regulated permease PerM
VWRIVQAVAIVGVLGFFLAETLTLLNPALLFLLLWAVMLPFRARPGYMALMVGAAGLTLFWVLSNTGSILAPFILSVVLAYILDPLVDRLEARGLSRSLSVLALIVPALAVVVALGLFLIPAAFREIGELLGAIPILLQRLGDWVEALQIRLQNMGVPVLENLGNRLDAVDSEAVVAFFQERQAELGAWGMETAMGLGRGLGSILTILGYIVLTPVLTYYLIRDWDDLMGRIGSLVPLTHREVVISFASEIDGLVSAYMRGQVTVAAIIGVLTGVGLALLSFPSAVTIGVIAGVFSIVPYLGVVVTIIPAVFIALVSGNVLISLAKVGVVFATIQVLDGSVISPRIVGDSVGIHPVIVVLAMSLGGYFFGLVGLLIAVPAAAVIKLLVLRGLDTYRASDFFRGSEASAGD